MNGDKQLWYYGKTGKDYSIEIPQALNKKLMSLEGVGAWCNRHGPEQMEDGSYYFMCGLPAGHDCKYHLSIGTDQAVAIWPA